MFVFTEPDIKADENMEHIQPKGPVFNTGLPLVSDVNKHI